MFFYGHLCSNFYCVNFRQITHIFRFLKARQGLVYEHFFGSGNDIAYRNIRRRRGTNCIEQRFVELLKPLGGKVNLTG